VHHLFNVPALLPIGDFLVHAREWTGRSADELLGLLRGATPDPLGAADELARLVVALRRDPATLELLATPAEPAEVVAALRSLPGEVGALATAYVDRVGYRPVNGEDVGEPSVHELPELVVAAIRSAVDAVASGREAEELESRTSEVRGDVPAGQRPAFDELLAEARAVSRLRDERGSYADQWAIGVMRRAILAAGARLAPLGGSASPAISPRPPTMRSARSSRPATAPPPRSSRSGRGTGRRRATPMRPRFSAASRRRHCRPSGFLPRPRGWSGRSAR
jgi:hypothetical protein